MKVRITFLCTLSWNWQFKDRGSMPSSKTKTNRTNQLSTFNQNGILSKKGSHKKVCWFDFNPAEKASGSLVRGQNEGVKYRVNKSCN